MSSAIMNEGISPATSATKSQRPRSITASTMPRASSSARGTRDRTARGVKAALTRRR